MYVHIGGDKVIRDTDIIVILQADQMSQEGIPEGTKSLVLTPDGLLYSPISSYTLKNRILSGGQGGEE